MVPTTAHITPPVGSSLSVFPNVGAGTHHDERERATRVDRDAPRFVELGACAFAVEVASSAATGECGDVIGGEVETADIVGVVVLRCIMGNT